MGWSLASTRTWNVTRPVRGDMAPTILAALNAPTSIGNEASAVSDTEADEMEEHPRGLGYLE